MFRFRGLVLFVFPSKLTAAGIHVTRKIKFSGPAQLQTEVILCDPRVQSKHEKGVCALDTDEREGVGTLGIATVPIT